MKIELFLATAISFLQGLVFFAGYICNNVFPQPLSEEDEAYYLRRAEEGDEEARNILIEHNLRLVAHIINRISTPFIVVLCGWPQVEMGWLDSAVAMGG